MLPFDPLREKLISDIEKARNSTVLVYVHDNSLSYQHVPAIYSQLRKIGKVENLDIFLFSYGGDPDAAYKIVKMCREHCSGKLSVIIPFMAKSAATLLAIGTDEIVMGSPSELGPIDPQIYDKASGRWGATQSIRDCVDFVEGRFKSANDMEISSYVLMPILDKLNPFIVGMFERAVKMSKQYAELLLRNGMLKDKTDQQIEKVVKILSESYFSHGYAIDSYEAKNDLFLNVVECNEELWDSIWNLFLTYHYDLNENEDNGSFIETREEINRRIHGDEEDFEEEDTYDDILDVDGQTASDIEQDEEKTEGIENSIKKLEIKV
jgi:hypothetical protein